MKLREYLRYGHAEAIVVTLDDHGKPNPAPMGIDLEDNYLVVRPYKTSRTYRNILRNVEASVNITNDSIVFFKALYFKHELKFRPARKLRVPVIDDFIDLYVEGKVDRIVDEGNRASFYLNVLDVYEGKGSRLGYSRANSALVDILIYASKIEALSGLIDCSSLKSMYEKISDLSLLIRRLGNEIINNALNFVLMRVSTIVKEYCGDLGK